MIVLILAGQIGFLEGKRTSPCATSYSGLGMQAVMNPYTVRVKYKMYIIMHRYLLTTKKVVTNQTEKSCWFVKAYKCRYDLPNCHWIVFSYISPLHHECHCYTLMPKLDFQFRCVFDALLILSIMKLL